MRKQLEMTLRSHSKDFRLSNSSSHFAPAKYLNKTSVNRLAILLRNRNASWGIYSGRGASCADVPFTTFTMTLKLSTFMCEGGTSISRLN